VTWLESLYNKIRPDLGELKLTRRMHRVTLCKKPRGSRCCAPALCNHNEHSSASFEEKMNNAHLSTNGSPTHNGGGAVNVPNSFFVPVFSSGGATFSFAMIQLFFRLVTASSVGAGKGDPVRPSLLACLRTNRALFPAISEQPSRLICYPHSERLGPARLIRLALSGRSSPEKKTCVSMCLSVLPFLTKYFLDLGDLAAGSMAVTRALRIGRAFILCILIACVALSGFWRSERTELISVSVQR
jgi:hypothetical protein